MYIGDQHILNDLNKKYKTEYEKLVLEINELPIDTRISNAFAREGISYIYDLVLMRRSDFGKIKNLGRKSEWQVREMLQEVGFDFGMNPGKIIRIFIRKRLKNEDIDLLERFDEWFMRVMEEQPNAPWGDETIESLHSMYRLEKTGLK